MKLDHLLIAAPELAAAKAAFERLGFSVVYGGRANRSLNALIFLRDGTLIELIGQDRFPSIVSAFRKVGVTRLFGLMIDRIAAFPSVPPGLFNCSLYSSDLRATYLRLSASGIAVGKPRRLKRRRDDNVPLSWELLGTAPYDLPFIIGDYHPSRLSDERNLVHANGATGIASLTIACADLERYVEIYRRLLGRAADANHSEPVFPCGGASIRLVEMPGPLSGFTQSDGSRPLTCSLRYDDGVERPFPVELSLLPQTS